MAANERTWITDPTTEGADYLVSVSRNGLLVGWVTGKMRLLMSLFYDQAYCEASGETPDDLAIFVLTNFAPVPVNIATSVIRGWGEGPDMIGYTIGWRVPGVRGKAGYRYETGARAQIDF